MTTAATAFGDLKVVDCDAHFTEPADLWTSRAPKAMRDRVPVQRTRDGMTKWYLDGELWASIGGNTIAAGAQKVLGTNSVQPFEAVDPAAWDPAARLALMDRVGIHAQVLYPNGIGFSSNHIFAVDDLEQRVAILRMYNDFLVDVQRQGRGRLFPQALLPIWDMDLTVAEMTRLVDQGITGFTLSDRPELLGLGELADPYFEPMWDLFDQSGTVANFHIGSGARKEEMERARARYSHRAGRAAPSEPASPATPEVPTVAEPAWSSFDRQRSLAVTSALMYMSNARIVANLCMSNLFDRHPGLKIVSAESGIGWVPFVLEALEYQLDEMVTEADERSFQQRRPTDYFRDHMYVTFWFEKVAPRKLLADVGIGNVLVETDIPHATCLFPDPAAHFAAAFDGVEPEVRRRVLQDNAAELYGISLDGVGR
ncbi:MAG TPA: amidohydrolase family protein [Acidimicrobiales bacterium]|nr:amidohydrolase family protein [Acidimicrobiales bacterium]